MQKRIGPIIEYWGTRQERVIEDEEEMPTETVKVLLDKYEEDQFKVEPETSPLV